MAYSTIPTTLDVPTLTIRKGDQITIVYAYRDGNVTPEWDGTWTLAVHVDVPDTFLPTLTSGPYTRDSIVGTMYRMAESVATLAGVPFVES